MAAPFTVIGTEEEEAEEMLADAMAMRSVDPALTAFRAREFDGRAYGHRPNHRPKRLEPPPPVPREAEIKAAAVCTPEVADAKPPPEPRMRRVDAFFRRTTLLITKRTGRHRERSLYAFPNECAKARPPIGTCQVWQGGVNARHPQDLSW